MAAGVVVLGSGRSGTSAIAHGFLAAGFFAGREDELYGPGKGNPLGHYEPLPVLRANEALLERLGCAWWAGAPPADAQLAIREEVEPRLERIVATLIASADGAPVAIKEPRIGGLLPLWGPVLEGTLHPVLALRDPLEMALSHARRDGTPVAHALASWEVQTIAILSWLDGGVATVAPYAELVARPELLGELVRAAARHLDGDRAAAVDPSAAASVMRADQRNESVAELRHDDYLTPRQAALWRYLEELPAGDAELTQPAELRRPSAAARAALRSEDERVELQAAHATLLAAHEETVERLRELERRFGELTALAQREAATADRSGRALAAVQSSASWRLTSPLRAVKRGSRQAHPPRT